MKKEKILHLSNDFADQKIYINLVRRLSAIGFAQVVYVPLKWENKIDGNRDESVPYVEYHYSFILKRNLLFKLRYHRKIKLIKSDIESKIDVSEISLVHAHFLFSDGGVAYLLKKQYGIPYVVNVRASDMFTFFHKMVHLRAFGNKIMSEAEKVVFVNPSYVNLFKQKYLINSFVGLGKNITVIPNAIDDKWFKNSPLKKSLNQKVKILYVGRIVKRKKLDIVIKAVKSLNRDNKREFVLEVVGEGVFMRKITKIADDSVVFHGKITDHEKLLDIYNNCQIFAMPSTKETFGLVYIEALTQGLPIIYCHNEGVDGFFKDGQVGVAIKPNNVQEVIAAVHRIMDNYESMSVYGPKAAKVFNWDQCTKLLTDVYDEAITQK